MLLTEGFSCLLLLVTKYSTEYLSRTTRPVTSSFAIFYTVKMETIHKLELLRSISHFSYSASECTITIQKCCSARHMEPKTFIVVEDMISQLTKDIANVYYVLPRDTTILTENDKLFQDCCSNCHGLFSQILEDWNLAKTKEERINVGNGQITVQSLPVLDHFEDSAIRIRDINDSLPKQLIPRQLAEIDAMLAGLALKNSRLSLNRTKELGQLKQEVQTHFRKVKFESPNSNEIAIILEGLLRITKEAIEISAEQAILGDLYFGTINNRQESIPKEHENTFKWIFHENDQHNVAQPHSSFVHWLTTDEPVYWISGKPGSGKSTLMKFLANDNRTRKLLEKWAGSDKLFTAAFYFWKLKIHCKSPVLDL
jgi:hypothetical protein